ARQAARASGSDLLGGGHGKRERDNRIGTAAPTARQGVLAGRVGTVRWNALGTPAALGPAPVRGSVKALATGLSTDPATAARQYLTQNADLFGFDGKSVAGMDTLLVRPIGSGRVVLLRQRFGDLPAGPDGLVAVLLNGGSVLRVTSSLARDTRAPEPATLSAADALRAA